MLGGGFAGYVEDRIEEPSLDVFGLQQLPDHGARDLPGAVGIPQHLAFGIGDQFLADTGVEEVSRHETRTISIWGLTAAACHLDPAQQFRSHDATLNPLIRRCFDSSHTNK